jgi:hypothetical protein
VVLEPQTDGEDDLMRWMRKNDNDLSLACAPRRAVSGPPQNRQVKLPLSEWSWAVLAICPL